MIVTVLSLGACKQPATVGKQVAGKLPFYNTADFTPQWIEPSSAGYKEIHTIPSFQFINQDGDKVSDKTVAGKIYVANFFFTSCPGICKRLTGNLTLVQTAFKNDAQVLLLSHSVTPETDSVARLRQYARNYGVISHKWHLLTGSREQIYQIARESYFADEDMGEVRRGPNDFLHTENVLLIDKHKRIRGVYKGTSVRDINDLIADIKILEQED
jgi:protein SCO1/2